MDLDIDLNADEHEMVLVVDSLDLAQIVAHASKWTGWSATGRLDGYIPVTLTGNSGLKIVKG